MKKIISILLIIILSLSGYVVVAEQKNNNDDFINETIFFTNPIITEDLNYNYVDLLDRDSFLLSPGKPRLPVIKKVYTFPIGTKIKSVEVDLSFDSTFRLPKKINPNSDITPLTKSTYENKISIDPLIYNSYQFYPSVEYDYNIGGGRNGKDNVVYLVINCYPIIYSPKKNLIKTASKADILINYEKTEKTINIIDENDLLIITPSKFLETLQPLITHKNSKGIITTTKTTEDIYNEYIGRDQSEQIKYFIYDAFYQMNISYVMLIGSVDNLPIRYTDIEFLYDKYGVPTDLYYADILDEYGDFCSWDSNENDKFGEFDWYLGPIDDVDLYPDVGIGRLACSSNDELKTVINKIINYETEAYGSEWFDKLITLGGDTFPGHNVIEGEVVSQEIIDTMPDFQPIQLWTSLNTFKPYIINSNINSGAGFVSYSGHGYPQGFGTSKPNVENRIQYYSYRLLGMKNNNKLPIFFFDACSTTELDFNWEGFEDYYPPLVKLIKILRGSSYDPLELYPCFAWMLIKKENGGAIATIGSTRVAYTWVDSDGVHAGASYLNVHFFEGYQPGIKISDMLIYSQNKYLNYVGLDCFTLEEFTLLGDPTLKVGGYP